MLLTAWMLQLPPVAYRHLTGGDASTGKVAIILQALVVLSTLSTAVGNASLPLLTHLAARGEGERGGKVRTLQLIGAILLAGIFVAALVTMLGPWLLPLLLDDAYREAGASIGFGLLELATLGAAHIAAQGLFARDRPRLPMLVTGAALLLGAVLFAPLLGAWAPPGSMGRWRRSISRWRCVPP
jgi:O-antigen/teichoic acid export membrane protein